MYSDKLKDWIFVKVLGIVHSEENPKTFYMEGHYDSYELIRVVKNADTGTFEETGSPSIKKKSEMVTRVFN